MNHPARKTLLWAGPAVAGVLMARSAWTHLRKKRHRGSVVLITGGNRGLGRELARQYLGAGATVIILGRDEEALAAAETELSELGDVIALRADITRAEQIADVTAEIERRFGRLDGLINNAGLVLGGPLRSTSAQDYDRLLQTNLYGTCRMTEAALPLLRGGKNPWIINISSAAGKLTVPYLVAYGASKAALARYSEGLMMQLAGEGIQVLTVYPSFIHTGVWDHAPVKDSKIPLRRAYNAISAIPFIAMSTPGAARRIIGAQSRGELKIVIPLSAEIFVRLVYLMPKLSARLAQGVARRLGEA